MTSLVKTDESAFLIEYTAKVTGLIDKMRIDLDKPAYDPEYVQALVERWVEHLMRKKVPLQSLENVYNIALDLRIVNDIRTSFNIEDMLRGWKELKEQETESSARKVYSPANCSRCHGSGYIIAMNNMGKEIEIACNHEQ